MQLPSNAVQEISMKARVTQLFDVKISPSEFMKELYYQWKLKCGFSDKEGYVWIEDGKWISWDDCRGQGSGLKEFVKFASEEEVKMYNAFTTILNSNFLKGKN